MQAVRQRQAKRAQVRAATVGDAPAQEAPQTTELELLEADLERDVIRQGPSPELWQEIMLVKQQRQKWLEAIVSASEGLWSLRYPSQAFAMPDQIDADLNQTFQHVITELAPQVASEMPHVAVVGALFARFSKKMSEGESISATMEMASELSSSDEHLGKKIRWLAWREILNKNNRFT